MKIKEYLELLKEKRPENFSNLKWERNPFLELLRSEEEILYGKEGLNLLKTKKLTQLIN